MNWYFKRDSEELDQLRPRQTASHPFAPPRTDSIRSLLICFDFLDEKPCLLISTYQRIGQPFAYSNRGNRNNG